MRDQPRARTRDATAPATGFPVAACDTFTVGDYGDDGFSLRRVPTGDMDKDGMPTPDNVFGQEDPLRIPVNVISHSG